MIDYLGKEYKICAICNEVIHRSALGWIDEAGHCFGATTPITPSHGHIPGSWSERPQTRFQSEEAQIFYAWSVDGMHDDDLGEQDTFGWYALFPDDNAILYLDDRGGVWLTMFATEDETDDQWNYLNEKWEEFSDMHDPEYGSYLDAP